MKKRLLPMRLKHFGIPTLFVVLYGALIFVFARYNGMPLFQLSDIAGLMQEGTDGKLAALQLSHFWHVVTAGGALLTGWVLIWRSVVAAEQLKRTEESLEHAKSESARQASERHTDALQSALRMLLRHGRANRTNSLSIEEQEYLAKDLLELAQKDDEPCPEILERLLSSRSGTQERRFSRPGSGDEVMPPIFAWQAFEPDQFRQHAAKYHSNLIAGKGNDPNSVSLPLESLAIYLLGKEKGIEIELINQGRFFELKQ